MRVRRFFSKNWLLLAVLIITGCAVYTARNFDQLYGPEEVRDRHISLLTEEPEFYRDIKPVFDKRCVVCHSCYDAPCQLKLSSFAGLDRGANKDKVYVGERLRAADPTRLFVDAKHTQEWRAKGFFPVLNERDQTDTANREAGVLSRMLALKQRHPLPEADILPDSFEFDLNRDQQCSAIENFGDFEKDYPLWGMPYALPALEQEEHNLIVRWLEQGAKSLESKPLNAAYRDEVSKWENYLNGSSVKQKLVSRYIYEHLFVANIYFPDVENLTPEKRQFFTLVRSKTPTGQPVDRISSRRPYDHPGTDVFFYRLIPVESTIVAKTHMPYRLDRERMARWDELFYENDYQVTRYPGFEPKLASNPFATFGELPIASRYKFMLDEAAFTISGFIKGPVCRGQVALNVIQDHFWVVFIDPDNHHMADVQEFLDQEKDYLRLPASDGSGGIPGIGWLKYSHLQHEYLSARIQRLTEIFPSKGDLSLDLVWDGDGWNDNAALTVFRHFDTATVMKGHWGKDPKTAWIIGYSLLERIHYLLVAGFDVFGNISHQLNSRLYMDFLRMEGESNFLGLLPTDVAEKELAYWYRDAESKVSEYLELMESRDDGTTAVRYLTEDPKSELFDLLRDKLKGAINDSDLINRPAMDQDKDPIIAQLQVLANTRGKSLSELSETTVLRVRTDSGDDRVFSIIRNLSHTNVSHLFREESRLKPEEQTVTVMEGIIGAYPNVFLDVKESELDKFVSQFTQLKSASDYQNLLNQYAVRRTNKGFWQFGDWLHSWYAQHDPEQHGILDFNRLENR